VQDGVNASKELQAAARKVEEENRRLKALLRAKGVCEREIDGFEGVSAEQWEDTSEGSALGRLLDERRPCYGAAQSANKHEAVPQNSAVTPSPLFSSTQDFRHPHHPYPTPPTPLMTFPPNLDDSTSYRFPSAQDQASTATWSDTTALASRTNGGSAEAEANDSRLSCEYAASIITGMKYDASALQVKQELGCGANEDCKVNHAALFEVMDRYSGDLP